MEIIDDMQSYMMLVGDDTVEAMSFPELIRSWNNSEAPEADIIVTDRSVCRNFVNEGNILIMEHHPFTPVFSFPDKVENGEQALHYLALATGPKYRNWQFSAMKM